MELLSGNLHRSLRTGKRTHRSCHLAKRCVTHKYCAREVVELFSSLRCWFHHGNPKLSLVYPFARSACSPTDKWDSQHSVHQFCSYFPVSKLTLDSTSVTKRPGWSIRCNVHGWMITLLLKLVLWVLLPIKLFKHTICKTDSRETDEWSISKHWL